MNHLQSFRATILAALGHAPDIIVPGTLHRFSTSCRRGDTSGWCKLFLDGRAGVLGDWRTGVSETWTAAGRCAMTRGERMVLARQVAQATTERMQVQEFEWAQQARRIGRMWAECAPIAPGDPVAQYLARRGFGDVWPLPACLRLHRAMRYWDGDRSIGVFPAMVAPVLAPGGSMVALHRTYLTANGRKAAVPRVKKLTRAAGRLTGAAIPLYAANAGVLGIAEGIETALAARFAAGVPTVAAYCAGNLAAWQWPKGVRCVVVYADNDPKGIEAAEHLLGRVRAAGLACEIQAPSKPGADWCDVWNAGRAIDGAFS